MDAGAQGSRSVFNMGNAARRAAIAVRTELMRRAADMLEAAGRTGETFTLNVLCLDVIPDASGVDDYAAFAAELAAMGFGVEYQVVPWFFTGGDPSDLAVRTEALRRFGDEVIGPLGSAT